MAPVASKLDKLPFNCYELAHTWNPNCHVAALELGTSVFKEGFKIYTTCYVISLLATKKIPKTSNDVVQGLKDILRSSAFLGMHGFGYAQFLCGIRKLRGKFDYWTVGFVPSFLASYIAIMIEKPQRRPLLALYVTNVATETTYRMLKARGLVKDIKHFDVFIFCFSIVAIIFYMKKGARRTDIVDSVLKKLLGHEEFSQEREERDVFMNLPERRISSTDNVGAPRRVSLGGPGLRVGRGDENILVEGNNNRQNIEDTYRNRFIQFVLWMHKEVENIASHLESMVTAVYEGQIHEMCPHDQPCFDYWMEGFYSRFLTGFGIHGVFQVFVLIKSLITPRKLALDQKGSLLSNSMLYPCIRSGMGLGVFCLAFRLINCSFRWLKGMDGPGHTATAGFLSSILGFFLIKPPNSLGLYLFFKAIETFISESHKKNSWKLLNILNQIYGGGWCLLYSISTGVPSLHQISPRLTPTKSRFRQLLRFFEGFLNIPRRIS